MKRKAFYISLIIIALIGFGADIALGARKTAMREKYCPRNNCSTTVKEYKELERESQALLSSDSLIAPNPTETLDESLDERLDESLIDTKEENVHESPAFIAEKEASTESEDAFMHNLFIFGLKAETKQHEVRGISFIAASEIRAEGKQETLAAAGANVYVDGTTSRDVYAAGAFVKFGKKSVQRDAYIAGAEITLSGHVLGNVYAAGGTVIFDNATIEHDVNIAAASIVFKGDTTVYGTLNYNEDARTENLDSKKIAGITTYVDIESKKDTLKTIFSYISKTCVYIISIALFSIIIAAIGRKSYTDIRETKNTASNFFKGLLVLIIIPIVAWLLSIVSYFNIVGSFAIILVGLGAAIATAFVTIRLGAFVSKNIVKAEDKSPYRDVLLGAITSGLIMLIPIIGATFIFVLVVLNLGLLSAMIKERGLLNLSSLEDDKSIKNAKK